MTTTISLATRDSIVLGCDSLATTSRAMVDPFKFGEDFFDENGIIRLDEKGLPKLASATQLHSYVERVPIDQLPNVTKLFHLKPIPVGVLFAGASAIGTWSIKNLVDAFLDCQEFAGIRNGGDYKVADVASLFLGFLKAKYETAYAEWAEKYRPTMEVVLSGYPKAGHQPEIYRITISPNPTCVPEVEAGVYDIIFSGQYDVIQRVVRGVDIEGYLGLWEKSDRILSLYHSQVVQLLKENGITVEIPPPDSTKNKELQLFHGDFGGVKGLNINRSSLSEQASINLVEFLIDTMIKAQQFSGSIPTVGGDIHIAIITKAGGFCWVSREEYLFRGHTVPKHGLNNRHA
jgi:hypothetical protein